MWACFCDALDKYREIINILICLTDIWILNMIHTEFVFCPVIELITIALFRIIAISICPLNYQHSHVIPWPIFLNYTLKDHIYLAIWIFTFLLRDIVYIRKTNNFLLISGHVYRRDSMWNKSLNANRVYWPLCQSTSQPYVVLVHYTTQATVFGIGERNKPG